MSPKLTIMKKSIITALLLSILVCAAQEITSLKDRTESASRLSKFAGSNVQLKMWPDADTVIIDVLDLFKASKWNVVSTRPPATNSGAGVRVWQELTTNSPAADGKGAVSGLVKEFQLHGIRAVAGVAQTNSSARTNTIVVEFGHQWRLDGDTRHAWATNTASPWGTNYINRVKRQGHP